MQPLHHRPAVTDKIYIGQNRIWHHVKTQPIRTSWDTAECTTLCWEEALFRRFFSERSLFNISRLKYYHWKIYRRIICYESSGHSHSVSRFKVWHSKHFKGPSFFSLILFAALPRTATGKMARCSIASSESDLIVHPWLHHSIKMH